MKIRHIVGLLLFVVGGIGPLSAGSSLYQVSLIDALLAGDYDGSVSLAALKEKGSLGIGTFDALNGEMVMVDSEIYRINDRGMVERPPMDEKTPFASVCSFAADVQMRVDEPCDYALLKQRIGAQLPTRNQFYAIRVRGDFNMIKVRSVPKQVKPYPDLIEVVKDQPEFKHEKIKGDLVGFWCPAYVKGINVPEFHLHFIDDARKVGGHLLNFSSDHLEVSIDYLDQFELDLPESESFQQLPLAEDKAKELHKVESDTK